MEVIVEVVARVVVGEMAEEAVAQRAVIPQVEPPGAVAARGARSQPAFTKPE